VVSGFSSSVVEVCVGSVSSTISVIVVELISGSVVSSGGSGSVVDGSELEAGGSVSVGQVEDELEAGGSVSVGQVEDELEAGGKVNVGGDVDDDVDETGA
jgi:hypothetical protein